MDCGHGKETATAVRGRDLPLNPVHTREAEDWDLAQKRRIERAISKLE
jgi:hypothetical protein